MTVILVTGPLHVGKSTVCRTVAHLARERGRRVLGIVIEPVFDAAGARGGQDIQNLLTGETRPLARFDTDWGGPSVGPYHFEPAALAWGQDVVANAVAAGCDLLVIDEIGRLELEQGIGFQRVLQVLGSAELPDCLVVVRDTLREAFEQRLPNLHLVPVEVSEANRSALPEEIVDRLWPPPRRVSGCGKAGCTCRDGPRTVTSFDSAPHVG